MRDWWELHQSRMTEELSPFYIGCPLPKKLDELRKVRQRMEEWLVLISSKAELLRVDIFGKNAGPEDYVVYAYTNPEKTLLILSFSAQEKYGMITREPVPYSIAEQVEEKTGMLFWSWNGQGRPVSHQRLSAAIGASSLGGKISGIFSCPRGRRYHRDTKGQNFRWSIRMGRK